MKAQASIEQLRIYKLSTELEAAIWKLRQLSAADANYDERERLWRQTAAIGHYIYEAHERYSYALKIESLQHARQALERINPLLGIYLDGSAQQRQRLQEQTTTLLKQVCGLIRYLRLQQQERATAMRIRSSDELVSAR